MSVSSTRSKNITFDDRDFRNILYENGWYNEGTWHSPQDSGTLSSAKDLNARLTFTFPQPAIAFYYYGIGRSYGGLYGICIDCDPNLMRFETVDGLNRTDNGQNPPVVLFSKTFNTPGTHVVVLTNRNDTRIFPSGNSQITVDRFVLEVPDDSPESPTQGQPTTASESSTAFASSSSLATSTSKNGSLSSASTLSSSSSTATPSPSSSPNSNSTSSTAIIAGAVGGSLIVVILIFAGCRWWRRRQHVTEAMINNGSFSPSGPFPSSPSQVGLSRRPSTPDLRCSSIDSIVHMLTTRRPDASGALGNAAEASTSPRMRWNHKIRRYVRSHAVIDGQAFPARAPPKFTSTLSNPLSNRHRPPVTDSTLGAFSQMHPAISEERRPLTNPFSPSNATPMSGSNFHPARERRRAVDAGPVIDEDTHGWDEELSALPPLYEEVFSSRVDQVRERSSPKPHV
ncbi:hypothetical protein PQX77_010975 [Marasmius sp. AFHP31]|nr:hypothetical protein PQX77_010975 [Marasmius sp. AFHP31]